MRFTIPNVFLPPRYYDISEGRDLLIEMSDDFTLHARWAGERLWEHLPLTPGGVRRLAKDVLRKARKYQNELEIYTRFTSIVGEQPLEESINHVQRSQEKEAQGQEKIRKKEEKEPAESGAEGEGQEVVAIFHSDEEREMALAMGGEGPIPKFDW